MQKWNIQSLRNYLDVPLSEAKNTGFMVEPPNRLRHETLCRLIAHPSSVFQRPVEFVQDGVLLDAFGELDVSAPCNEVQIERNETASRGNPRALSLTECNRRAFLGCGGEIVRCVDALFGFANYPIHDRQGRQVESFVQIVEDFSGAFDETNQLRILFRIAEVIYASPFENSSKMVEGVPFCSGWEMWGRMEQGGGGICAEKTGALKFICDVLGVSTFYAAGSQYTIPEDFELQLKRYITSEGDGPQPIWIQHLLLGFQIGESDYLVDVSNGNLPFLFISGDDLNRYLNVGYRARMVYQMEQMNLRRISNWAGDALLTLCEFHVPNLAFQYIFDQALGLHISSTLYIGAFFDYGGIRTARYQGHYTALAEPLRLPCPRFIGENNMHSLPDEALQQTLKKVLVALREHYDNPHYSGDFTFVVQPLNRVRIPPRISRDILKEVR